MGKSHHRKVNLDDLKSRYSYDFSTGVFTRLKNNWNFKVGDILENKTPDGYLILGIGKSQFLAHRMAWLYHYGEMPNGMLDHINGDRSDNRIENLRVVGSLENTWNTKKHSDNKSGYKGVHYHKQNDTWRAVIMANGKRIHIGLFKTPEIAHDAYCNFAKKLFGEYARVA